MEEHREAMTNKLQSKLLTLLAVMSTGRAGAP